MRQQRLNWAPHSAVELIIFTNNLWIQTCLDDASQQVQKKGTMQYAAINPTSAKYAQGLSSTQNSTAGGSTTM